MAEFTPALEFTFAIKRYQKGKSDNGISSSLFRIVIREKIGYTCTDKSKFEQDIKERG